MRHILRFLPVIAVLGLSYLAVKPLFIPGFYTMHDNTQVQRVYEMTKSLHDGLFPVRWVSDLGYGYGYPIFNFYAPLAYYLGSFINILGASPLVATKFMIGLGIVLAGVFMFFFAEAFWGKTGGLISALLYLYSPYHALDLYVRGDVAELYAYAFIPLAFLGIYKIYCWSSNSDYSKNKNTHPVTLNVWFWLAVGSFGYAGIVLSHNLSALMVTPYILVFTLLLYSLSRFNTPPNKQYFVILPLIIGILISCFYWLPALTEMKYTNVISQLGGGSNYKQNYACLSELWNSQWGYGGSVPGCIKGLSLRAGKFI
jgi:uncharacterized membrane protein